MNEKLGWQTSCKTSQFLKKWKPKYLESCCTVNRMVAGAVLDILSLDNNVGRFDGVVDVETFEGVLFISNNLSSSGVIWPYVSRCAVTLCKIS